MAGGGDVDRDAGEGHGGPRRAGARLRPTVYGCVLLLAVSIEPFASFIANNPKYSFSLSALLGYVVAVFAVAVVIWLALAALLPRVDANRIALGVGAGVFAFFKADLILNTDPRGMVRWIQPFVWLLVAALLVYLVVRLSANATARTFVLAFASVWAVIALFNAVTVSSSAGEGDADDLVQADIEFVPIEGDKPNVYWFVFDEYARNDQLAALAGFDNEAFYEELRERGFEVSESSMASYARTHLSLPSTLAMDYIVQPGNDLDVAEYRTLAPVLAGENATVERFREHGYQYLFADQATLPWTQCLDDVADHCIPPASGGLTEFDIALLKLTPFGGMPFDMPHNDPTDVLDRVEGLGDQVEEPFFLFAHNNSPHFPYRFDEDCDLRSEPISHAPLDRNQWAHYYRQDVLCVNEQILAAVDRIIEHDPEAIIVLQSDHGSPSTVEWGQDPDSWSQTTLVERFGALNAMRLPDRCDDVEVEGLALINTFRVVFGCLEGQDIPLLPHRAYLAPFDDLTAIEPVDPARFEEP